MTDILLHAFLPAPYYPTRCDAKIDDGGQPRTCTRPPAEHLDQQPIGSLPEKMADGTTVAAAGPYVEIDDAIQGVMLLGPDYALALARALILAAHEVKRGPRS